MNVGCTATLGGTAISLHDFTLFIPLCDYIWLYIYIIEHTRNCWRIFGKNSAEIKEVRSFRLVCFLIGFRKMHLELYFLIEWSVDLKFCWLNIFIHAWSSRISVALAVVLWMFNRREANYGNKFIAWLECFHVHDFPVKCLLDFSRRFVAFAFGSRGRHLLFSVEHYCCERPNPILQVCQCILSRF